MSKIQEGDIVKVKSTGLFSLTTYGFVSKEDSFLSGIYYVYSLEMENFFTARAEEIFTARAEEMEVVQKEDIPEDLVKIVAHFIARQICGMEIYSNEQ
jgi:predicted site-specific integrase-resolvase